MAQNATGNLYVIAVDEQGDALPGVSVEVSGLGAPKTGITNTQGRVHFLALDPGNYRLEAKLDGFSPLEYPTIVIGLSRNTELEVSLSSAIEESMTVTAESPLLDPRKQVSGTAISQIELEKIPSARDPWALLSQAPGVLLDRVNVGGSESGVASTYVGPGTGLADNTWIVDGVETTDRRSPGLAPSSSYYDFDQFAEIQIETGGSDITRASAGVSVELVTKRGSNEFRGSARFLLTDQDGYFGALKQGDISVDPNELGPNQGPDTFTANQVVRMQDYGFEAGGPLWRDRLWAWGSWSNTDIVNTASIAISDRFILENTSIKLNAQLSSSNSAMGSFNNGDKLIFNRGAASNRASDSLWNQRGPTAIAKFEDTHVFSSSFFLSGQYAKVDGGVALASTGGCGPDGLEYHVGADGIHHGRGCGGSDYPSDEWKVDGSAFFTSGNMNHEVKFGGRMRDYEHSKPWTYPGRNILNYDGGYFGVQDPGLLDFFGLPPGRAGDAAFVYAYRAGEAPTSVQYNSLWVSDTLIWSNWTVNMGIRYDRQDGENPADTAPANLAFPQVIPDLVFDGDDGGGLSWESISPRVGVTYALGEERKTLLRGSLARFPEPLSASHIGRTNPAGGALGGQFASILFLDDAGGRTGIYDDGEDFAVIGGLFGFDPDDPTASTSTNINDPDMDVPLVDELLLGVEHAFLPEFVVGIQYTFRHFTDVSDEQLLFFDDSGSQVTASRADYVPGNPFTFSFPGESEVFHHTPLVARPGLTFSGGSLLTNGDREKTYNGVTLNLTKRLANRWMARGYINFGEAKWKIPPSYFDHNDPNIQVQETPGVANLAAVDGAIVAEQSGGGGKKKDIFMQATWSFNVNGMYQFAPERWYGFNVAGNVYGREGYPIPYYVNTFGADGIPREISANDVSGGDIDLFRSDDLMIVDLRLEKEFAASGNTSLTFSIDAFNVFDQDAVLSRIRNLNSFRAGWLNETLPPRIFRLGVRLNWR